MADFHVIGGATKAVAHPQIRKIQMSDLRDVLRAGLSDFWDKPSHYAFLGLIYAVVGIALAIWSSGANALPMVFPLASGFALLGPIAAIGLYEISRRKEQGQDTSWIHAIEVMRSPALPSIIAVGIMIFAIFYLWLAAAESIYQATFGMSAPTSVTAFLSEVFTTSQGWQLMLWGCGVGFLFALVTLATTVIAFPLMLDRDVGAFAAIETSVRAFMANPIPLLAWGLIVAVLLTIGSIPFFVGLAVVVPVLGHATWHLYRKLVA
ncbi:DUF2189 domain-containing protein [Paradevosia shaoguanensis]|uniref:DUF2189 domain-containing protein n=1 Tax=Paradevosia shaoguanensis TaxID=1335043 RepID=A0AA41QLY9_9HYPH|nr:DUF2189 domain-containing protein [Paradevosia shaoguanensis]KFL28505.1 cytochrome C oxidase subunit I [Devosia sp. 17-2-E-8]MCF1742838.1 DUF2189 domain-containing protein [Paradevosia shaoguanensis]MCI0127321.1 DUF2189 domain-containing protein [Paradevosia shaoguanensis]CDP52633.1 Mlr8238 protein [Devosia sp. DBB001]